MSRDYFKIISGIDYFHRPDKLGNYFIDNKSYYIDFTSKVNWQGDFVDNIPVLYFPSLNKNVYFPSMIFQYGLGSIDMYFKTMNDQYLKKINYVYIWILDNIKSDYSFDNRFIELHKGIDYYSNNSAMTQGEAISFLVRADKYGLVKNESVKTKELIKNIYKNMILPVERGGTAVYDDNSVYFYEYCRKDNLIVLNGWIFAIFGLYDYQQYFNTQDSYLTGTLNTLEHDINDYIIKENKWSYYDNKKRISSSVYQFTHISQLNALYRLTKNKVFNDVYDELKMGYNLKNKVKYNFLKILDKLKDKIPYSCSK